MAVGFLARSGLGAIATGVRTKTFALTDEGLAAKQRSEETLREVERRFRDRFGRRADDLHDALQPVFEGGAAPPVARAVANPRGWRSKIARVDALPDHPMVLHRGGFPDGA